MVHEKFAGLGTALVTPFKPDLSIDFQALENILEHIISGGTDYIVVLGTTAETPTLSPGEKESIIKFVKDHNKGRVPLVIGMGGNNTQSVIADLSSYDLDGYDAVLSVTPYYNKPSQEGLYQHFKAISDASPLPIILYNVPGRTGVNLSPHTIKRLVDYSDKFVAVKEASGNIQQAREIIGLTSPDFGLIAGNDSDIVPFYEIGGIGVISVLANAFPGVVKRLMVPEKSENSDAHAIQEELTKVIKPLFEEGNPSGIKYLLHLLGLSENILRLPLVPVSKGVEDKIKKGLDLIKEL